jgi:hypothetical protein
MLSAVMMLGPHKISLGIHAGRHLTEDLDVDGKTYQIDMVRLYEDNAHWQGRVTYTAINFGSHKTWRISGPAQQRFSFSRRNFPSEIVYSWVYVSVCLTTSVKNIKMSGLA